MRGVHGGSELSNVREFLIETARTRLAQNIFDVCQVCEIEKIHVHSITLLNVPHTVNFQGVTV